MYSGVPTIWAKPVNSVLSVSGWPTRLGHPEVDHLGHRLPVVQRDQDVGRLEVAVDDALLVGVLHRLADVDEQPQPVPRTSRRLWSQNSVIGTPRTSSMTKYGRPESVAPASKTLAMLGWSIRARACRSASNRATTCAGVHPRLDDLQGHPAADRVRLLGHEHHAEPALADLLHQLVRADHRAGAVRRPAASRPAVAAGSWARRTPGTTRRAGGGRASPRPPRGGRRPRRTPGRGTPGGRPAGRSRGRRGRSPSPGRSGCSRRRLRRPLRVVTRQCEKAGGEPAKKCRAGQQDSPGLSLRRRAVGQLAVQPGAGERPVPLGGPQRDVRGRRPPVPSSGRRSTGVPPAGPRRGRRPGAGSAPVEVQQPSAGSAAASRDLVEVDAVPPAAVLDGPACGGRCRRGCGAWPRPRRRRSGRGRSSAGPDPPPTSRRYASWTRAVAWSVWPGSSAAIRAAASLRSSS